MHNMNRERTASGFENKPLDFTKPVQTRDGRNVRILCTDGGGEYPVIGYCDPLEGDGDEGRIIGCWLLSGKTVSFGGDHELDLINAPPSARDG